MLQFMIGLVIGGIIGFGTCAFLCAASDDRRAEVPRKKETGDEDVQNEY